MTSKIEALDTTGTRERVHDAAMNVKVPKEVKALLESIGGKSGVSAIVRVAIKEYLVKRGY